MGRWVGGIAGGCCCHHLLRLMAVSPHSFLSGMMSLFSTAVFFTPQDRLRGSDVDIHEIQYRVDLNIVATSLFRMEMTLTRSPRMVQNSAAKPTA